MQRPNAGWVKMQRPNAGWVKMQRPNAGWVKMQRPNAGWVKMQRRDGEENAPRTGQSRETRVGMRLSGHRERRVTLCGEQRAALWARMR
jgi:hypothetical protein